MILTKKAMQKEKSKKRARKEHKMRVSVNVGVRSDMLGTLTRLLHNLKVTVISFQKRGLVMIQFASPSLLIF